MIIASRFTAQEGVCYHKLVIRQGEKREAMPPLDTIFWRQVGGNINRKHEALRQLSRAG